MREIDHANAVAQERIAYLESLLRAREQKITELGNLLHAGKLVQPSRFKLFLVRVWEGLPKSVQRRIEPFADFVDRKIK
jgi:hypothetical protein